MASKDISDLVVCQEAAEWMADRTYNLIERLQASTGEHVKVCYAAAERACDRGLLEYGVSIRVPWLTDKGKALVAAAITPTCTGHAAALQWQAGGGIGFPVVPEGGLVYPNAGDTSRIDIKFQDGSWLILQIGSVDRRLSVFWGAKE